MQRIVQDHNLYKPAPTAYEDKGSFAKTHGPFFGSSKRTELTETEKTPAPNVYNFDNASTYAARTNPRCKIGTEPRNPDFAIDNQSPGPGRYDKKTFVDTNEAKKKGFSCRNKTADLIAAELSKVPGPGHYQPTSSHHKKAPRCSASQAKRKTFMDDMQATNP